MVDPFESLRHDAERTGSAAIDPRFRADLLAEARRRLSSDSSTDSIRPRVPTDTPTLRPMEPITMLAQQPKKTRPLLLAAACVALVGAGVLAVVALQDDDDKPPATVDTTPTPATVPSDGTSAPTTPPTVPATSASAPTTEAITDRAIARDILLPPDAYADGWSLSNANWGAGFDPRHVDQMPACASFMSSVFDPIAESAQDLRLWSPLSPPAIWPEYVMVLSDAAAAQSVFEVVNSADFAPCAVDYKAVQAVTGNSLLPNEFDRPMSDPPGGAVGDAVAFRSYGFTWVDDQGGEHQDLVLEATVRVDRALIFIGTLESENGVEVVSEDQFRDILERAVARAASALNAPTPSSGVTVPTLEPLTDAQIAEAMLLTGDEYGGWIVVSESSFLDVSMDSTLASGLAECSPFVASVFDRVDPNATSTRLFMHEDPGAIFSQYVVVFPDVATARAVYDIVNGSEFAPCAVAYGTTITRGASNPEGQQNPAPLPSPFDQPISVPPFGPVGWAMTYRTFDEGGLQSDLDAVMLVDRTITFIGTPTIGAGGAVLNTVDQFEAALQRIVERANAALTGNPIT